MNFVNFILACESFKKKIIWHFYLTQNDIIPLHTETEESFLYLTGEKKKSLKDLRWMEHLIVEIKDA